MKKLVDQNGRLFGLISLIDLVVVAIALVLLGALSFKSSSTPISSTAAPMTPVTYQLTVSNMPAGRLNSLRVGDPLFDQETFHHLGNITDIAVEDCRISILKKDGTFGYADVEGRYNVVLTIQAEALIDERQHIYVNRTDFIAVGWSLNVYTQASLFNGLVTGLEQ